MRLITEKSKNEIGKRLSAIYYIALHGFGNGMETDIQSTTKIIEHVCEIAYAVGGDRFANVEIPCYVDRLKMEVEHETD